MTGKKQVLRIEIMKYFFWIAFAVFLAASIPHVAYFFASFEPSGGTEGIWWWTVSYAIAISIDVTVYLLSWTAFQRYRRFRTARAVWQHWLLIVMCTVFSWAVNWAYAKQFHSPTMLSAAETTAPWLTGIFPFKASAFPLLGIVYTMMAETISESEAEERRTREKQVQALSELSKQTQLPIATLRRALRVGRLTQPNLLEEKSGESAGGSGAGESSVMAELGNVRTVTGQILAVNTVSAENTGQPATGNTGQLKPVQATNPGMASVLKDASNDKLQMTIEALRARPDMTDEALAEHLSLKRPASARFWRLKAIEILNASAAAEREQAGLAGPGAGTQSNGWMASNGVR